MYSQDVTDPRVRERTTSNSNEYGRWGEIECVYAAQNKALMSQTVSLSRSNLRTACQVILMPLTQYIYLFIHLFLNVGSPASLTLSLSRQMLMGFRLQEMLVHFPDRRNNLTSGPRGLHLLPQRPSQGGYQTTEVEE